MNQGEKKERSSFEITESSNERKREREKNHVNVWKAVALNLTIPRPRYYFLGFLYNILYSKKEYHRLDGSDKKRYVHERNGLKREGKKKLRGTKGNGTRTENSGGMKRMLNIGRLKQSQKRRIGWKRQREGIWKREEICDMKEGGKRHGNVSYIRRTVFVFRMWEDEFPWNLGCSIRNCLFFLWFRRASCEKYSIRGGMEGRIEERIEKVGRWFSSEISFLSNILKTGFPYFISCNYSRSKMLEIYFFQL